MVIKYWIRYLHCLSEPLVSEMYPYLLVAFVQSCNSCMSKPVSVGVREYACECIFLYWLMQTLKQPKFFINVHQKYLDSCQNCKKGREGMTTKH